MESNSEKVRTSYFQVVTDAKRYQLISEIFRALIIAIIYRQLHLPLYYFYLTIKLEPTMSTQKTTIIYPNQPELLLLYDEENLSSPLNSGDLLDELVRQPHLAKQQSIKYDYQPNLKTLFSQVINEKCLQQRTTQNQCQKVVKCNCSKTKCQKNYCECFKAGRACTQQCSCTECHNDELSKIAVFPKRNSGSGCKCQKSHCMKNYCECHSAGRKCGEECLCIQCNNIEGESQIEKPPRKKYKKMEREQIQEIRY